MEKKSREEARADGDKYFYTGVPCVHGHDTFRWVSNKCCVDCVAEQSASWKARHPEVVQSWSRKYRDRKNGPVLDLLITLERESNE